MDESEKRSLAKRLEGIEQHGGQLRANGHGVGAGGLLSELTCLTDPRSSCVSARTSTPPSR